MTDDSNPTDLTFLTNDELVAELRKRFDAVLVCGWKHMTSKEDQTYFNWMGGLVPSIGLAERARNRLVAISLKQEEDDE